MEHRERNKGLARLLETASILGKKQEDVSKMVMAYDCIKDNLKHRMRENKTMFDTKPYLCSAALNTCEYQRANIQYHGEDGKTVPQCYYKVVRSLVDDVLEE